MSESEFDTGEMPRSGAYVACRCEDVSLTEVILALRNGACTLNDVKRRTRAGMGPCQGIYCMPAVAALVAEATGVPISQVEPMTLRPPVRMVALELFAAEQQSEAIRFHTREGIEHGEEG
jgi:NAD(P)H-nitrite reductase large subunit